jgi:hypothetical protein
MSDPFKALLEPTTKKASSTIKIKMQESSGRYRLGAPTRPNIVHDNGFLDAFKPESPTLADRKNYAIWYAKGTGAKALCNETIGPVLPKCGHENQTEAVDAYLHYMNASGADRIVDYGKYLNQDPNGMKLLGSIVADAKKHIEVIGYNRTKFQVTSEPYFVGGNDKKFPDPPLRSLYPATINWQRAIGAHPVWISAAVEIYIDSSGQSCRLAHAAEITFHMEDMYNFNPNMHDIATGIPDGENGRFQIVGLAKQYLNKGTYTTKVSW